MVATTAVEVLPVHVAQLHGVVGFDGFQSGTMVLCIVCHNGQELQAGSLQVLQASLQELASVASKRLTDLT